MVLFKFYDYLYAFKREVAIFYKRQKQKALYGLLFFNNLKWSYCPDILYKIVTQNKCY